MTAPRPDQRRRRLLAFTLVEMLVAISIIVVLSALTIAASVAVVRKSEVRQTRNLLQLLDGAMQTWQLEADRSLTWGVGSPAAYEMDNETPHVFTITEVLDALGRTEAVGTALAQIQPELLHTYDFNETQPPWLRAEDPDDPDPRLVEPTLDDWEGKLAVLDAWGTPIRAVHPGPTAPAGYLGTKDPDGTVRLDLSNSYGVEQIYGAGAGRRVRFVSAGPDRKFGSLSALGHSPRSAEELRDQARDNIYSYDLEAPSP